MNCAGCQQPIQGQYINFQGQAWHPACLNCEKCGTPLHSVLMKDGKRMCQRCAMDVCSQCKQPMEQGLTFEGELWCRSCFKCADCGKPLTSAYKADRPGVFCRECVSPHCSKCNSIIDGQAVQLDGKVVCSRCFVCEACGAPFPGGQFYQKGGMKVCSNCVNKVADPQPTPDLGGGPDAVPSGTSGPNGSTETAPSTGSTGDAADGRRLVVKAQKDENTLWQWQGGYVQHGDHAGRPLFMRDTADGQALFFIYFHPNFGKWFIGQSVCSSGAVSFSCQSVDDAASPELCQWDTQKVQKIYEKADVFGKSDDLGAAPALFTDPGFPHVLAPTINGPGVSPTNLRNPSWVPARLLKKGHWQLFDGIQPRDLLQGEMGDCWLIAALSTLAEYPEAIKKVFKVEGSQTDGRFVVELFDHKTKAPVDLEIDEYIPCRKAYWWEEETKPYFSRPNGNEMWCLLMEKSMAKLFGSYAHLQGGIPNTCWRAVTGCTDQLSWSRKGAQWVKSYMAPDTLNQFMYGPDSEKASNDEVWRILLTQHCWQCHLMGASIENNCEAERPDGLVAGHAFALLGLFEVPCALGTLRMLLVRNPWGNEKEWKGNWCDHHPLWAQYPDVQAKLRPQFKDDGLFFMQWEDFSSTFNQVHISAKSMLEGDKLATVQQALKDLDEQSDLHIFDLLAQKNHADVRRKQGRQPPQGYASA